MEKERAKVEQELIERYINIGGDEEGDEMFDNISVPIDNYNTPAASTGKQTEFTGETSFYVRE